MTLSHIRRGISEKIFLGFVVMALAVGGLGGYGIYVLDTAGGVVAQTFDRPLMTVNYARAAHQDFTEMLEERFRSRTVSMEQVAEMERRVPEIERAIFDELAVALDRADTDDERRQINEIENLITTWSDRWAETNGAAAGLQLEPLARQIDDAFDRLVETATDNAFIERRRALDTIRHFKYTSVGSAILALLLAVAITFMLTRRIVRPLSAAAQIADRIAGGELDTVIPKGGRDETGILLQSLHVMQDNIRVMVAREQTQRRSAQARLVDALEGAHEGMMLIDAKGRLLIANSQMTEFFPAAAPMFGEGNDFAAVEPRLIAHFLKPEETPHLTETAARGAEFQLAGGRWIRVSRSTTRDGGMFLFFSDFTEVKEREQRYLEAQRAAEAASRAKSSFLANMSHELRTPLNAIIGFSDMIAQQTYGPIGNRHYLGYAADILQSGRHLLSIINGVLDLAKSQTGKLTVHREPVDLCETLNECASMMRDQCARGGITLETVDPGVNLIVSGEPAKLRQIFLNLLSNAVKFTEPGGRVSLVAKPPRDGMLVVEVRDTGIGMSAQEIPIALAPFGQVDSRLARRYDGTGLGLPLAKELVDLHDGALVIESTPGKGTTVRVTLPALQTPALIASAAA